MNIITSVKSGLAPVHREGWRFVAIFAVITLLFQYLGWWPLTLIGIVLTAWCAYFFRDPKRVTPQSDHLVISPADGKISAIMQVIPPPELDLPREPHLRISVFMNVFDVHINRAPVSGRITRLAYVPGAFFNAELDKASEDNERQALTVEGPKGLQLGVVQIAGLVARRIVKFVSEGDHLTQGQRFGLIRFGSRVDVYLPASVKPLVGVGQRALAGETILADLAGADTALSYRAG